MTNENAQKATSELNAGLGIWVLTQDFNDYDQHGSYFEGAWIAKPTAEQLKNAGVPTSDIEHVLLGGGRRGSEYSWYDLFKHDA